MIPSIRAAVANDYPVLVKIINKAYWKEQKHYFIDSPLSRNRLNLTQLSELVSKQAFKFFVMVNPLDEVMGVIASELPPEKDYGKFELFALDKSCQGKGLGINLIRYVEEYAFNNGRNSMKIEVFTFASKLESYYIRLGYVSTGIFFDFVHSTCVKEEYTNSEGLYLKELIKVLKPTD